MDSFCCFFISRNCFFDLLKLLICVAVSIIVLSVTIPCINLRENSCRFEYYISKIFDRGCQFSFWTHEYNKINISTSKALSIIKKLIVKTFYVEILNTYFHFKKSSQSIKPNVPSVFLQISLNFNDNRTKSIKKSLERTYKYTFVKENIRK